MLYFLQVFRYNLPLIAIETLRGKGTIHFYANHQICYQTRQASKRTT